MLDGTSRVRVLVSRSKAYGSVVIYSVVEKEDVKEYACRQYKEYRNVERNVFGHSRRTSPLNRQFSTSAVLFV